MGADRVEERALRCPGEARALSGGVPWAGPSLPFVIEQFSLIERSSISSMLYDEPQTLIRNELETSSRKVKKS